MKRYERECTVCGEENIEGYFLCESCNNSDNPNIIRLKELRLKSIKLRKARKKNLKLIGDTIHEMFVLYRKIDYERDEN